MTSPMRMVAATCQKCGGEIEGWTCQECGQTFRENDAGALVFAASPPPGELREKIARIIDPLKWGRFDRHPPHADHVPRATSIEWSAGLKDSLRKADAILSAIGAGHGGEGES